MSKRYVRKVEKTDVEDVSANNLLAIYDLVTERTGRAPQFHLYENEEEDAEIIGTRKELEYYLKQKPPITRVFSSQVDASQFPDTHEIQISFFKRSRTLDIEIRALESKQSQLDWVMGTLSRFEKLLNKPLSGNSVHPNESSETILSGTTIQNSVVNIGDSNNSVQNNSADSPSSVVLQLWQLILGVLAIIVAIAIAIWQSR